MAVREALLTLLAVEPTYGFRLHTELIRRLPQRRSLNVGQSYATLERLGKADLIEPAGTNEDGLPLFRITDPGRTVVRDWLAGRDGAGTSIEETSDRVLLTLSLADLLPQELTPPEGVLRNEIRRWETFDRPHDGTTHPIEAASHDLEARQRAATLAWLRSLTEHVADEFCLVAAADHPRRGRPKRRPVDEPAR